MQTTQISPLNLLYFSTTTKVTDLGQYVGVIADRLYADAIANNLRIIGPPYWLYDGFEGDYNKLFTLEIAIPIETLPLNYTGEFALKSTEHFKCVWDILEGKWTKIPETYAKIFAYMAENGLKPTHKNREIYIHTDLESPETMITMIQVGVQ
jgi:hypothetical protein